MSHLSLDARAILEYLNELGYRNISAAQLKEFIKDLRKLIKYEENVGINANQGDYFENLFKRTTASYRARIDKENAQEQMKSSDTSSSIKSSIESRGGTKKQIAAPIRSGEEAAKGTQKLRSSPSAHTRRLVHRAASISSNNIGGRKLQFGQSKKPTCEGIDCPSSGESEVGKTIPARRVASNDLNREPTSTTSRTVQSESIASRTRGTSSSRLQKTEDTTASYLPQSERLSPRSKSSKGAMISRRLVKSPKHKPIRNDPVALYAYYQREWKHFRKQIPGEDSHADLRWHIRHRLLDPDK